METRLQTNYGLFLVRCRAFVPVECPSCGARVLDLVAAMNPQGQPQFVCESCSEFRAPYKGANLQYQYKG